MKKILMLLFLVVFLNKINGQTIDTADYPVVGKPCPDFIFHHVKYYPKNTVSLNDLRDKWLVLDFWNKGCGACIASFPTINKIQAKFTGQLQWMLVGIQDPEKQIEAMFDRFQKREHLLIPCAFDSLLANRWEIHAAPHLIVIDPQGIVRAITIHLEESDIVTLLSGKESHLVNPFQYDFEKERRIPFDYKKPYAINGNGGADTSFLFRSVLSAYDGTFQHDYFPDSISQDSSYGRLQVLGAPAAILFNYAYFGTMWPGKQYHKIPVIEAKDTTAFQYSSSNSHNLFCYSLSLPPLSATKKQLQQVMKRDLENYFNCTASIEEYQFRCWRLVSTNQARQRLATKGGPTLLKIKIPKVDFSAQNYPFKYFLLYLGGGGIEIVDDTGITGNIDIHFNGVLTDVNEIKNALRKNGLDLVPGKRTIKTLVIRDK